MDDKKLSEKYKSWAVEAYDYTESKLKFGAINRFEGGNYVFSRVWGCMILRLVPCIEENGMSTKEQARAIFERANYAKGVQTGNCQEHAAVTFDYLARSGRRQIAIIARADSPLYGHAVVVCGFDYTCDFTKLSDFPDWSWVSDPWANVVIQTNKLTPPNAYSEVFSLRENELYTETSLWK